MFLEFSLLSTDEPVTVNTDFITKISPINGNRKAAGCQIQLQGIQAAITVAQSYPQVLQMVGAKG